MSDEYVVLVTESNRRIGTALKRTIHTIHTPLHRGFSLFLFNSHGQTLLTKRSGKKATFPGVWTNAVCGHPAPGESVISAAQRRARRELGIHVRTIKIRADYRYRFADANGIVENEICPILTAYTDDIPVPDADETEEWKWITWNALREDMKQNPHLYSPWSREEAVIITPLI
jgi:isopentenyl-diphosphate delta-isomerase